jgi:predicted phosphodiesterase
MPKKVVVGVVSDTHGLLRSQALARLRGVTRIVHAGDVVSSEVLAASCPFEAKRWRYHTRTRSFGAR